jgi:hypothetical protein
VDAGASFVACSQAKPRSTTQRIFPKIGAVGNAAAGDLGPDAAFTEQAAVLVEVVAAIGVELAWLAWPATGWAG